MMSHVPDFLIFLRIPVMNCRKLYLIFAGAGRFHRHQCLPGFALGPVLDATMSSTDNVPLESEGPSHKEHPSILRRSIQAVFSPFSPAALALLPRLRRPARYTRADAIPETQPDSQGQQPTVRDYHAINLPPQVRVPKKMSTPIRVEGKVWFANERSKLISGLCSSVMFV
jgi:hypothetical protein